MTAQAMKAILIDSITWVMTKMVAGMAAIVGVFISGYRKGNSAAETNDGSVVVRLPPGLIINRGIIQPTMHQLSEAIHRRETNTARSNNGSSQGS